MKLLALRTYVCCVHSDCVAVEVPKPEGVPDRKRYGAMKLLQFHGNYRPAYWGTWSKKSSRISPRFPLRLDKVNFHELLQHLAFGLFKNAFIFFKIKY